MSAEFEALKKELDTVKGIAERVYRIIDVGTGWHLPKIAKRGIPLDHGTYFTTPEPMIDAGIKLLHEVKSKRTRLPFPGFSIAPPGQERPARNLLKERIVEKLSKENKVHIDFVPSGATVSLKGSTTQTSDLFITNGISPSMFTVPLMLCNADDEVLITEPDYGPIRVAQMFGKLVRVPLKERKGVIDETRWYFDPDELERRITEKSKLFMFTNPNNPLGYVYSKRDLAAIARIAKKYDLFVLTNECYERMDFRDEFEKTLIFNSLAALPGMVERTFTIQGLTKAFETEESMTVGWIHGPMAYLNVLKWLQFTSCQKWGTALGNWMGIAALSKPFRQEYARLRLTDYRWGRDLMWEMLKKFPWIECGKAKGGPFMFPDVSKCGKSDEDLAEFLRGQGVGVWGGTPWAETPKYGKNHIRLSYCSPRILQKAMTLQLEKALKKYEELNKAIIKT